MLQYWSVKHDGGPCVPTRTGYSVTKSCRRPPPPPHVGCVVTHSNICWVILFNNKIHTPQISYNAIISNVAYLLYIMYCFRFHMCVNFQTLCVYTWHVTIVSMYVSKGHAYAGTITYDHCKAGLTATTYFYWY